MQAPAAPDAAKEKVDAAKKTEPAAAQGEQPPKDKKSNGNGKAMLNGHAEVFFDQELPEYAFGEVKAYRADSVKNGIGQCFAYVCEPHLIPRVKAAEIYPIFVNSATASLIDKGKVFWPPAGQERYVLLYKEGLGKKMMQPGEVQAKGWKQEQVLETLVHPLVSVLQDFKDKDFSHGSIMPSNLYDGGAGDQVRKVVLGDCLSMPCSYAQPSVYLTIERSMAMPAGRGVSTPADDLYALGVTVAAFMRHTDPLEGLTDEQIVRKKMELGSYAAITGKDRFKGSILELLRGLLHDDASQRWTLEEVNIWLDGSRLSPKQATRVKKAPRPLVFNEKKYSYLPFFAMDMHKNPPDVLRVIESDELQQWLTRAFEDDEAVERLEKAMMEASVGGKGANYNDRLVMNVSAALDLMAPLRYKGLSLLAESFGNCLAQAVIMKQDIRPYVELLSSTMVLNWIAQSENPALDKGALFGKFDHCRSHLLQKKVGYGLERCLYELAPEVRCLSEKLKDYYVRSPEDMVMAFEDLCSKGKAPPLFLDRHSIAFLSVKDSKCIDSFLYDLNGAEEYKKVLGNLKCLAVIQNRSKIGALPEIAKTFLKMLPCVYERYHDRDTREKLQKGIERFAASGDLVKIAALLDNTDVIAKDYGAFNSAMAEYQQLTKEAESLEKRLENKDLFGKQTGKELAAVISSVVAGAIILGVSFMFLTGNSLF